MSAMKSAEQILAEGIAEREGPVGRSTRGAKAARPGPRLALPAWVPSGQRRKGRKAKARAPSPFTLAQISHVHL